MKRRVIHQWKHRFDKYPFEAFWCDSWLPVERLKIRDGAISTNIIKNDQVVEEHIPLSHLRVRSRKALYYDCTLFLRPGIDICVLCTSQNSDDEPVWIDAKIRSIQRKQHDLGCDCQFFVSFYIDQAPDTFLGSKKLSKESFTVKIDQISILQRLETNPSYTKYYRWCFSEDCYSVQRFRLLTCRFSADISWLLVASVMKQTAFEVVTLQNHIAYAVSEYIPDIVLNVPQVTYTLNLKEENGISTPVISRFDSSKIEPECYGREVGFLSCHEHTELRRSKRRTKKPDRFLAIDNVPDYEIEVTRLGENKTYALEYDNISSSSDNDEEECGDGMILPLSVQGDNEYRKHIGDEKWNRAYERRVREGSKNKSRVKYTPSQSEKNGEEEKELALVPSIVSDTDINKLVFGDKNAENVDESDSHTEDMVSKFFYMNSPQSLSKKQKPLNGDFDGDKRRTRSKYFHAKNGPKKECVYVRESIYDVRSFKSGSVSAQLCRDLIRRCMNNIDATLKNEPIQPPVLDQWKEFQSAKFTNKTKQEEKLSNKNEPELSEIDMLWNEMELALASWYLLDDIEKPHVKSSSEAKILSEKSEKKCEHEFMIDEQVGNICRLCGFVETEIKDILPPFTENTHFTPTKEQRADEDALKPKQRNEGEMEQFCIPAQSNTRSNVGETEKNVWELIPELKEKLRLHQKRAFQFLWRNIAGSTVPSRIEKKQKKRGGCVISHSPGAGKTLLIIAFLVSYLKLFPGSRPLVLAPKTTLYTWYKEIIKWNVPVPVYQIHGGQTYKGEVLKQRMNLAPGLPKNQDVLHVLDCLEKMQRWLSHPSILLMGYTSFLTLTREDSPYAHRKYMAQLLKQCPGILILDEGHNPRSTKSRLRKALMKVNTRLRVLLSGTLFQNNFGEYFNTLLLARPSFVKEVLTELDPKYEEKNKDRLTQFSLENRGRKLLIDKISKKIDSSKYGERAQALKTLKKLTSKFINVYEGGTSDELPGLQCYTLMMKSTSLQQEILTKLQNRRPVYKGFPLELELLITLGAIHPWLISTTQCSRAYFLAEELEDLEQYKFDMKSGSKVRFVMNLIPGCLVRNEKVLIFCHNIAPINLFIQLFERFYGWRKGREVLVLQGDIELFERGRVMDKFEEARGASKIMLASITACAEGISLTAASRVILLDSEWNPSKSKQAIARAFRPGQNKVVYVYQLLATGTLEEEKHGRTTWKEWVSDMIFSDEHVEDPSHWQAPKIEDELLREIVEEDRAALFHRIMKNEKASNFIRGKAPTTSDEPSIVYQISGNKASDGKAWITYQRFAKGAPRKIFQTNNEPQESQI